MQSHGWLVKVPVVVVGNTDIVVVGDTVPEVVW